MFLTKIFQNKISTSILCIGIAVLLFSCSGEKKIYSYKNIEALRDTAFTEYHQRKFQPAYLNYNLLLNKKFATFQDMFYAAHSAAFSGHYNRSLEIMKEMLKNPQKELAEKEVSFLINRNWSYYIPLEKENKFQKINKQLRYQKPDSSFLNLSTLLNSCFRRDQNIRIEYSKNHTKENELTMDRIGFVNDEIIDSVLGKYGFLSYKKLGYKAYLSLFTLYQHLNKKSFLNNFSLIEEAYKDKSILKPEYAYILDRYDTYTNKKQKFGTQFIYDSLKESNILLPVANWKHIDKCRMKMELSTIEEYAKQNKILLTDVR